MIRQIGSDVGATASAAPDIALGGQAFVSEHHGLPGNAKFLGEGAAWRKASTAGKGSGQNTVAKVVEDGTLPGLVWREHDVGSLPIGPIAGPYGISRR